MFTSQDIKNTVELSLQDLVSDYDVEAIVEEYKSTFGLTSEVDDEDYWNVVSHHAL
jgi:L-arabinose isomerase